MKQSGMATATVSTTKERALDALKFLPPFSQIHNRLIASLALPDVSFAKMAELIEKDTAIAGNILSLANSPLYGQLGAVNSVRHAIAILGINKVRNVTLSMSLASTWKQVKATPSYSIREFNLNAVAVAILCDLLAQQLRAEYVESAFVAGLFHDLGRRLSAISVPDEYMELSGLYLESGLWPVDCERQLFGFTLAELSADVLAIWNLPVPIRNAVRYQDTPELDAPGTKTNLSLILNVARRYIDESGTTPPMQKRAETGRDINSLELDDGVDAVLSDFKDEFDAIKAYF